MAGEKLSPRQQMISLMYLVLLAMLAMQASKDLLDAFTKLESGIDITNDSFNLKNKALYREIEQSTLTGSPDAIEVFKKSQIIKLAADSIFDLLESHKVWLIEEGGGLGEDSIPLGKDNQDLGAEYFITKGEGKNLREKLNAFETLLSSYIDSDYPEVKNQIHKLLETPKYKDPEGIEMDWEIGFSEHIPLAAVTANLSNIQSYVRNAETEVVSYLYNKIKDDLFKFDKLEGMVMSPRAYVLRGDTFSANVFLGAFNTKISPVIYVGEYDTALFHETGEVHFPGKYDSIPVANGIGRYSVNTIESGNKSWKGIIKIPHPNPKKQGVYLYYPFKNQYTVAEPAGVVSLTAMNLVYTGIPNPVEISIPGFSNDKIRANFTGGSISPSGNGKFKIHANRIGRQKIIVEVEVSPGKFQQMKVLDVIVKNPPIPIVMLNTSEGKIKISKARARAGQLILKYDESFVFKDAKAKLISYKISFKTGSDLLGPFDSRTKKNEIDNIMSKISKGDKIYYEDIWVKQPGGTRAKAQEVSYEIIR